MRMRYRGFVHRFLSGILIGIGCILPGVSGGVMAISFGLYRPALDALLTFFHDTAKKLRDPRQSHPSQLSFPTILISLWSNDIIYFCS